MASKLNPRRQAVPFGLLLSSMLVFAIAITGCASTDVPRQANGPADPAANGAGLPAMPKTLKSGFDPYGDQPKPSAPPKGGGHDHHQHGASKEDDR